MSLIQGVDSISKIFSIFHDGIIAEYKMACGALLLDVRISYLAQQVHPDYSGFRITLYAVTQLSFTTWPKEAGVAPSTLLTCADIFAPALAILGGEQEGELIKVICNQPSAGSAHCGGELFFSASGALVTVEAGREYAIDALGELGTAYWDQWANRNRPC